MRRSAAALQSWECVLGECHPGVPRLAVPALRPLVPCVTSCQPPWATQPPAATSCSQTMSPCPTLNAEASTAHSDSCPLGGADQLTDVPDGTRRAVVGARPTASSGGGATHISALHSDASILSLLPRTTPMPLSSLPTPLPVLSHWLMLPGLCKQRSASAARSHTALCKAATAAPATAATGASLPGGCDWASCSEGGKRSVKPFRVIGAGGAVEGSSDTTMVDSRRGSSSSWVRRAPCSPRACQRASLSEQLMLKVGAPRPGLRLVSPTACCGPSTSPASGTPAGRSTLPNTLGCMHAALVTAGA
mmetsp:Transcript_15215/g.45897  ORF Transcript_15215/g.45897 Transcript_15215/m.45897 type:complete len:305 (+) Transcript_15215:609-1523(+)